MIYRFLFPEPHKHLVTIEFTFSAEAGRKIQLQLPAWRPGRYELSNYARNLMHISATDLNGEPVGLSRISKESWEIVPHEATYITLKYTMYACQMDAGGSWVDEKLVYLNFINNIIYIKGKENQPVEVEINIPAGFKTVCGISFENGHLTASSIYKLLDSPMVASPDLLVRSYEINNINFYIWSLGYNFQRWDRVLNDFRKFTEIQLAMMGEFPEIEYHFINIFLPYRFHHGVEHANSTMIVLGESNLTETKDYYDNFLGISSHELFHAWNICKIRPAEMLPYNFNQENYFPTGYVAEGFTTYYGDLFLVKSGVYSQEDYFTELNMTLKRHFENFGRFNYSLTDSSFDLWIDGYVTGTPNRKVSIYVKGCVVALMLDLSIRKLTDGMKSLDDVLRILYYDFAKKGLGYRHEDICQICKNITNTSFKTFFERYVEGTADETIELAGLLEWVGCELEISNADATTERMYGMRTTERNNNIYVAEVEPGSPADKYLAKDDEILMIDGTPAAEAVKQLTGKTNSINLKVIKRSGESEITLQADSNNYFRQYRIKKIINQTESQQRNYKNWLNQ